MPTTVAAAVTTPTNDTAKTTAATTAAPTNGTAATAAKTAPTNATTTAAGTTPHPIEEEGISLSFSRFIVDNIQKPAAYRNDWVLIFMYSALKSTLSNVTNKICGR